MEEVERELVAAGIPAGKVRSPAEGLEESILRERGDVSAVRHPELGEFPRSRPSECRSGCATVWQVTALRHRGSASTTKPFTGNGWDSVPTSWRVGKRRESSKRRALSVALQSSPEQTVASDEASP